MNTQILTGVIAVLGLLANLAGVGAATAQDGHAMHAEPADHGHHHADFASDRLHIRVDGAEGGKDIILIPGLSSSPEVWDGTVAHLGAGWRVHRIHIQGFAGAPAEGNATGPVAAPVAEEIARYITEKHLDHPVIVGHSMGGTIGLMLAARHPDLVGKLMVVDMVPFLGAMFGGPGSTVESVTPIADQIYAGMANSPPEAYQARAATTVAGMVNNAEARAAVLVDTADSDQKVSAASYRELLVTDLTPELPHVTAPTEVLYVTFNVPGMTAATTDAIYQSAFASLPGVTLKRVDDSAHFIMLDQPDAFYADLDAFLAK
ncbi:alpha/beta hydrolase [soil metagenome]